MILEKNQTILFKRHEKDSPVLARVKRYLRNQIEVMVPGCIEKEISPTTFRMLPEKKWKWSVMVIDAEQICGVGNEGIDNYYVRTGNIWKLKH